MAKSKIELEVSISGTDSVEQAENKTKSLKAQLREMKTLLASGTLSTEEFEKLAQAAGELQDRIADVNSTVANLGSDSRRLEGLIGITEGIAGGFAAAQGVAALFGEENEDLQKTMVKLQASMSVVQGLTAINNALQKESAAMLLLSSIQTKALAAGQTFLSLTTMKSVAATYALRGALIATGIGAIVVLVAALAGAFSDVAESTNEATEAQKAFNDKAKELDNISVGAIKRETELNKLRLKLKGETNDKLIDEDIEFLKREQTYLNLQLEDAKKRDYKVKEAKDNLARNLDEIEKLRLEKELFYKEEADKKEQELQKKKEDRANKQKSENEKRLAEEKRLLEEKQRAELEHEKNVLEIKKEAQLNIQLSQLQEREKEYLMLSIEHEKKMAIVKGNQEAEQLLKMEFEISKQAISDKYIEESRIKFEENEKQRTELEKQNAEQRIQAAQQEAQAKQQIANDTANIINNIGETLLGQQFKNTAVGKTIALTQIASDTAVAISSLTKNSEANPLNAVTSGAAGTAQFISGLARITANIAKAKSILSGGGAGSSGGGSGSSGNNQAQGQPQRLSTFIPQQDQQGGITRVVVLEKDITSTQDRVARIRDNATIE